MPTATTSVIAASLNLYDTLDAANFPGGSRPEIYFDEAPTVKADGTQLYPPYVVLKDGTGRTPDIQSDCGGTEDGNITLEVFANTLGDVDTIVQAIKLNGGTPKQRLGFDCGTLTLTSPYTPMHMIRTNERRSLAGIGKTGQRTHMCELTYMVMTSLNAAG